MLKSIIKKENTYGRGLLWAMICILGRIIPHPFNATPMTSLSLFSGSYFKRWQALLLTLISLAVSDAIIAHLYHYAVLGSWSLFTYSGLLLITLAGSLNLSMTKLNTVLTYTLMATLGFWVWTNFGTWLMSNLYPHTWLGLETCFLAGLPFLKNALLGNAVWSSIIFYILAYHQKRLASSKEQTKLTEH